MDKTNVVKTKYNTPWIANRADPYVYKAKDGFYYFTASVPEYDRIVLRRSKRLKDLACAEEAVIWKRHDSGIMSEHIWAPEIHYLDGKWYIYFAAGEKEDKWKIRPYVLECQGKDPMTGEWIEKGRMQSCDGDDLSFTSFSLDATVFEHRGKRYLVWAEKVQLKELVSNLYIAEMESPIKLKTKRVLLTTPEYDWEIVEFYVNEGPAILKKNNKIFLTYSASSTGACYCVGMLVADEDADLLDPGSWTKMKEPVLRTDESKAVYGPGHNSFTVSEDGKEIMVFHARQYSQIVGDPLYDPNRHTMFLEIKWNKDGMPEFEYMSNEA